ncbi:hypothetical protein Tco_0521914 [Tanacetum coccineum]
MANNRVLFAFNSFFLSSFYLAVLGRMRPSVPALADAIADLQYQIDNHQPKVRRRDIIPYLRFTKIIINYFLFKHNSIYKRHGSKYNTFEDDGVLGRLKFISKGEEHQVYGKPIPDILVTDDIQNSKAYKTFIALSTGLIPPKKGRGKRAKGMMTSKDRPI